MSGRGTKWPRRLDAYLFRCANCEAVIRGYRQLRTECPVCGRNVATRQENNGTRWTRRPYPHHGLDGEPCDGSRHTVAPSECWPVKSGPPGNKKQRNRNERG